MTTGGAVASVADDRQTIREALDAGTRAVLARLSGDEAELFMFMVGKMLAASGGHPAPLPNEQIATTAARELGWTVEHARQTLRNLGASVAFPVGHSDAPPEPQKLELTKPQRELLDLVNVFFQRGEQVGTRRAAVLLGWPRHHVKRVAAELVELGLLNHRKK